MTDCSGFHGLRFPTLLNFIYTGSLYDLIVANCPRTVRIARIFSFFLSIPSRNCHCQSCDFNLLSDWCILLCTPTPYASPPGALYTKYMDHLPPLCVGVFRKNFFLPLVYLLKRLIPKKIPATKKTKLIKNVPKATVIVVNLLHSFILRVYMRRTKIVSSKKSCS